MIVFDHVVPPANIDSAELQRKIRGFVSRQGIENFFMEGVCHQILAERFVKPGDIVIGADSHTCTHGAFGAFATGVGSTDIAAVFATGEIWLRVPESIKLDVKGSLTKGVFAKDLILHIIGMMGANGANYKAVEFCGEAVESLSVSSRLTITNMAIEMSAKSGIIGADDKLSQFLNSRQGTRQGMVFSSDENANYADEIEINASSIEPTIACPHAVDNTKVVTEVWGTEINQAYLGSCTNGRLEDIAMAVRIIKGEKVARGVRFVITPASKEVYGAALREGYIEELMRAGGIVCNPNCGPCVGRHQGVLAAGEVCISTMNRNFKGRMGSPDSEIYIASPATVTASAIEGKIVDPRLYL